MQNDPNQNLQPAVQPAVEVTQADSDRLARSKRFTTENILDYLFRFGFAAVFLINSATSMIQPESFTKLLENNFIANGIGHYDVLLRVITLNDFILGVLILSGIKKKYVYAWAGLWLAAVTFFKTTILI